jgi:transposase
LLCGKTYKSLAFHLSKIHHVSSDEYKEMYGLPWLRGLTGTATRALFIEMGKDRHSKGLLYSTSESLAKAHAAAKNQRTRAPMRDVLSDRNRIAMTKEQKRLTHDGKTMAVEAWADELGIHPATIYDRLNKGKTVAEALSNDFTLLTEKQVEEIRGLLADGGMSQQKIAEKYGVVQGTISFIHTGTTHGNKGA